MATKTKTRNSSSEQQIEELKNKLADAERKLGTSSKGETSKLSSDDDIEVMSLSIYPLTLNTKRLGNKDGYEYNFESFGEVKRIVYSHLSNIIESHKAFVEYPYFYIMDERVIKRHGLGDLYSKILRKEQIDSILECGDRSVVELFKSAPTKQKEIIVGILIRKIFDGQEVDLNIVSAISRESGVDILERVKVSKEMLEEEPAS